MRLSLCMIVKNEARYLEQCLDSVAGIVDEMIIVDTGSTDDTAKIAATYGAKVIPARWQNDFSAARNLSLQHATGDWILVLDADEELDPSSHQRLRHMVENTRADGVKVILRNLAPAHEVCRYHDLLITRLFRNRPEHRYEGVIHEQIQPAILRNGGSIVASDIVVLHHGYEEPTAQGLDHRAERNMMLLEHAMADAPWDAYLHYQLGTTHKSLGNIEEAAYHLKLAQLLDSGSLGSEVLATLNMKLAQISLAENDYAQAIYYSEQSLGHNPVNMVAMYVSAVAHMFLGRVGHAYGYFRKIRVAPDYNPAMVGELDTIIDHCQMVLAA